LVIDEIQSLKAAATCSSVQPRFKPEFGFNTGKIVKKHAAACYWCAPYDRTRHGQLGQQPLAGLESKHQMQFQSQFLLLPKPSKHFLHYGILLLVLESI
jgi:hypothetical protein